MLMPPSRLLEDRPQFTKERQISIGKNKLWLQNNDNWNKDNNMNILQIQIEFYEKRNEQISSSAISEMISESHYILRRADTALSLRNTRGDIW